MAAFGIVVVVSAFVGWVGHLLTRKYPDHPPMPVLALYTVLVLVGGVFSFLAFAASTRSFPMFAVCAWMLVWIPTLYIYSQLVGAFTAKGLTDWLFASTIKTPPRLGHGRGKNLMLQGHYEGAKQAFLDEFHARPKDPEPLMAGARMLSKEGCHEFAMDLYREVLSHFRDNTQVWVEAAWQFATLLEERMNMPDDASNLWRQIVRRAPNTTIGRMAGAKLQQKICRSHGPAEPQP